MGRGAAWLRSWCSASPRASRAAATRLGLAPYRENEQGIALDALGRHEEARVHYKRAIGYGIRVEVPTFNLARSVHREGGYSEAPRPLSGGAGDRPTTARGPLQRRSRPLRMGPGRAGPQQLRPRAHSRAVGARPAALGAGGLSNQGESEHRQEGASQPRRSDGGARRTARADREPAPRVPRRRRWRRPRRSPEDSDGGEGEGGSSSGGGGGGGEPPPPSGGGGSGDDPQPPPQGGGSGDDPQPPPQGGGSGDDPQPPPQGGGSGDDPQPSTPGRRKR